MKIQMILPLLLLPLAWADDKEPHDHDQKEQHAEHKIKAPNGGRILHQIEPHAEFFITKERKVQITFLDDDGKAIEGKPTLQAVGGERSAPTKFTFQKTKHGFLSDEKLPEGMKVPILLMFKDGEGKKIPTIKFNVDLNDCPTCQFLEYACTCGHDHEGHDHEEKAPAKE